MKKLACEPPRERPTDDTQNRYEIGLSHNEACALIRGDVPPAVQDFLISLVVQMHSTPAENMESEKRRRARKQAA